MYKITLKNKNKIKRTIDKYKMTGNQEVSKNEASPCLIETFTIVQ